MRSALKHGLGLLIRVLLRLRRLVSPGRPAKAPQKVALIADIGLGNAVMALPLLRSLRMNQPGMQITILTTPGTAAIFHLTHLADRIVLLKGSAGRRILQTAALHREGFDLCLVTFPTLSLSSELLPLWLGARENIIHDYRSIQPFFRYLTGLYAPPIALKAELHDVEQNLGLLPNGWRAVPEYPPLEITADAQDNAAALLAACGLREGEPFICMHPGGKRGAHYKRWPVDNFRALAEEIYRTYGFRTLAILGPDETELAEPLRAPALMPLVISDLEIIVAVLEKSSYFISNDSGMMHVASLLGKPQLAIWGATDPKRNRSWNAQAINVINEAATCHPCIRFVPTGKHLNCRRECIAGITVHAVLMRTATHLSAARQHPSGNLQQL